MGQRFALFVIAIVAFLNNQVLSFSVGPRNFPLPKKASTFTHGVTARDTRLFVSATEPSTEPNDEPVSPEAPTPAFPEERLDAIKETLLKVGILAVVLLMAYNITLLAFGAVATVVTSVFSAFGNEIFSELGNVVSFFFTVIFAALETLWEGLRFLVPYVGKGVMAAGEAAAPIVQDASNAVMDVASPLVQDASQQLSEAAAPYVDSVSQVVDSTVVTPLMDAKSSVAGVVDTTLQDAGNAVTGALDTNILSPMKEATSSVSNLPLKLF